MQYIFKQDVRIVKYTNFMIRDPKMGKIVTTTEGIVCLIHVLPTNSMKTRKLCSLINTFVSRFSNIWVENYVLNTKYVPSSAHFQKKTFQVWKISKITLDNSIKAGA